MRNGGTLYQVAFGRRRGLSRLMGVGEDAGYHLQVENGKEIPREPVYHTARYRPPLPGFLFASDILRILIWLHKGRRNLLKGRPRDTQNELLRGVFATCPPDRPNPTGLHRVEVLEIRKPGRIRVGPLEALDGTPIVDIKPVIPESDER